MKNPLVFIPLAVAVTSASASAANFMLITSQTTTDPYISFLTSNYPGSTVNVALFTDHTATATTNAVAAADLIIFSRTTDSSLFNNPGESTYWNSVTKPIILSNAYIARGAGASPRHGWLSNDTLTLGQSVGGNETTLTSAGAAFFGLGAGANDLLEGAGYEISGASSSTTLGGGTLLGTTSGATPYVTIASWDAGQAAANGDIFGGKRLYFATASGFSPTASGTTAMKTAINSMIPEPSVSILSVLALGAMTLRRRRSPV